jgi:hypothetical protein
LICDDESFFSDIFYSLCKLFPPPFIIMYFPILGAFLTLNLPLTLASQSYEGPDPSSLPLKTLFPGPWESNIKAPLNKSHIAPVRIFHFEGTTTGAASVLQDAHKDVSADGLTWGISPGGLITFEFAENIGGK